VADDSSLAGLIRALPDALRTRALTHSSWADHRAESYGRLAFLGDGVLGLAVAEELFRRFPRSDIGRLTKVHGQAVSGRACAEVAEAIGLPAMLREAAPEPSESGIDTDSLVASERALASMLEAMIGACYLEHGYERTSAATAAAFEPEIELASETLLDFKSALQEELARSGSTVSYFVVRETGPPHERRFDVEATVGDEVVGSGSGRSKKAAEQAAARQALERITQ
jgi:ribonuclease-3